MGKLTSLDYKERVFVNEYLKTGNQTDAALKAYDLTSRESAGSRGSQIMARPNVQNRIQKVLERRGLSEDYSVRKLKSLTNARKKLIHGKGLVSVPDNPTRMEAVKTVLKLQGYLDANNVVDNRQVTLNVSNEGGKMDEIIGRLQRLNEQLGVGQSGEVVDYDVEG